jgi:hypothetical protein
MKPLISNPCFSMRRREGIKYYRIDLMLIYNLPYSPLIIETKGNGSHYVVSKL